MSSVEFTWGPEDVDDLIAATEVDEAVLISLDKLSEKTARILEAGAGTGRVLRFLADRGYNNVVGIELNMAAVEEFNRRFPELQMIQGDILAMPYEPQSFDAVLSYGVIEHFETLGPVPPLRAMYDVLRPGGLAVVTVPTANVLRRLGDAKHSLRERVRLRSNPTLRRAFKKPALPRRTTNAFGYAVYPRDGGFFEYRLTPAQFHRACADAGFEILESRPIYHIDGLYHSLGGRGIRFEYWRFMVPPWLSVVNRILRCIPYFHNHMHLCVVRRPLASRRDS
jgi:SAM-dependent methyltransferase